MTRRLRRYFENLFVGADEEANATFGGSPDETISSRAARARNKGRRWGICLCWLLDLVQKGHCDQALKNRYDHPETLDIED